MNTSTLRVGVVGVGARSHLALNAEKGPVSAKIVAACEPSPLARTRVSQRLERDPDSLVLTENLGDFIAADLDIAFVTSPDDPRGYHLPATRSRRGRVPGKAASYHYGRRHPGAAHRL